MSISLYELTNEYKEFQAAIEAGQIPEEAITDTLEAISGEIEVKADNIACIIKDMLADVAKFDVEERAIRERRAATKRNIERLKEYLSEQLLKAGLTKIETARNRISFRKSSKVSISDEEAFIAWAESNCREFLKITTEINKTELKSVLDSNVEVPYASVESNVNIQIR